MDVVFVLGKQETNFDACTCVHDKQAILRFAQAAAISVAGNTTRYVDAYEATCIMGTEHH